MSKDLADAFPAVREAWTAADAALGVPLSKLAFEGPAEELTLTHNAQPALLTHGAAVWAVTKEKIAARVKAAAGHSLGEFTAFHAAGSLTLPDAAKLVRRRGELMFEAGTARPGAMAAVLGDLQRPIDEICREASAGGTVVPANYNTVEQTVISGEVAAVDKAMELAKAAGAKRVMKLNTSGAFHSPLVEPAAKGLEAAIAAAAWSEPAWPVYCNVTAAPTRSAAEARSLLLRQLTSPVRWVDQIRAMAAAHPGATFVEMGPGNVLTGMLKRLAPNNPARTCGTVPEVEALLNS
jgi:[acyl-carrier-protein] S-malonyltransferase